MNYITGLDFTINDYKIKAANAWTIDPKGIARFIGDVAMASFPCFYTVNGEMNATLYPEPRKSVLEYAGKNVSREIREGHGLAFAQVYTIPVKLHNGAGRGFMVYVKVRVSFGTTSMTIKMEGDA